MRRTADSIEEGNANRELGENKQKSTRGDAARIAPWQWKPGQSGNPGGRPKNDIAKLLAQAIFENNMESAYKGLAKALCKGNAYVFKELAERGYGKLTDKLQHSGAIGNGTDLSKLSDGELAELRRLFQRARTSE